MNRLRAWPWPTALLLMAVLGVSTWSVFSRAAAFAPDTRYYAAMALHLGGQSQQEAFEHVKAFVDQFGYATPPPDTLFGWGLVAPRIVYPVLSVPFVLMFGIPGMQVVPVVAMGAGLLVILRVGRLNAGLGATVAALLILELSPRMIFYGGAMLTESLAMLITAALALALPWSGERRTRRALLTSIGLLTVLAFTRQATLIPAGAAVIAWVGASVKLRSPRNAWAPYAVWLSVAAVALQVGQSVLFPGFNQLNQFLRVTHTDSLGAALIQAPGLAWHIISTDVLGMVRQPDLAWLALFMLAVVSGVVRWRHTDAHLLIGAVLATLLYNVTNGTPTQFRYGMPGLVFVVVAVALLLRSAVERRIVPTLAVDPVPTHEEVEHGVDGDGEGLGQDQAQAEARQ